MRGAALALVALVAACGSRSTPPAPETPPSRGTTHFRPERVVIGAVLPLTGGDAARGDQAKRGIEVAVQRVEASGGIDGVPVAVLFYDSESTDAGAFYSAGRAAEDGVAVILGELSPTRTAAIADAAQPSRIPIVSPNLTDYRVLRLPRVHSMARRDAHVMAIMVRFAIAKGWTDIASLAGSRPPLSRTLQRSGGRLVAHETCSYGTRFSTALTTLQQATPDTVLVFCEPRWSSLITSAAQSVGLWVPFVADSRWNQDRVVSDPANDGVYIVTYFHQNDPTATQFVDAYRALHGAEPTELAALAHDAATVALDAISRTRSLRPQRLEEAIEDSIDLPLATGVQAWHEKRPPTMAVVQIDGGTTAFIDRVAIR